MTDRPTPEPDYRPTTDLREFAAAALDGSIDADALARLESMLKSEPAARHYFARLAQLTALLERRDATLAPAQPGTPAPASASDSPKPRAAAQRGPGVSHTHHILRPLYALAAAVLLAAAAFAVYLTLSPSDSKRDPHRLQLDAPVAVLLGANGGTLVADTGPLTPGAEFRSGSVFLDRGDAEFQLVNGVAVALRGETRLRIDGPMHATLARGSATFECPHAAAGYTVHLPGGARVIDLGTRFRVEADPDGSARVAVTEGAVAIELPDSDERYLVTAGRSARLSGARLDAIETAPRSVELRPIADTYVNAQRPSEPLGADDRLVANEWPDSGPRWTYIRFDLRGVAGRIVHAQLELTTVVGATRPDHYQVLGLIGPDDWTETGPDAVTFVTAPARIDDSIDPTRIAGGAPLADFAATATPGQTVTAFDVDAGPVLDFLDADGDDDRVVTLILRERPDARTNSGDAWASRESATPPVLRLRVVDPIDPQTVTESIHPPSPKEISR